MGLHDFHLPLTALDQINQPPLWFLQVQDAMTVTFTLSWTTAYILYVRQAFKDKSYGVPLLTLWLNTAWEIMFGIVCAGSTGLIFVAGPWVLLEIALIYATIKYGSIEWRHSPLVANNLWWMIPAAQPVACGFYYALMQSFNKEKPQDSIIMSALANQVFTSIGAVLHLISKGNTKGHSVGIWFWRTNGTFWTVMCHYWQMTHYPQDHYFNFSPIVQYGMWIFEACDFIIYPIVYYYVSQRERDAEKPAAGQKPKMR
ncbi:hypothetical protein S7711_07096 [Stachybotrys chartarum IBT 7711]|uniref:Uncharacterized protein n=1 Tax=Stachybotrys chartarum (strain CBS 109288 / IBT 7711) TaxID=1280523 RepID=A0A084B318_STACB|nr:hypothetical protein S7711_07096 [Stachybotrys chartarum IBT 7711]KFA50684.1 hypothetical protein S40293_04872 [Stachybotrys chartarum IBT 40293]KFA80173.1 hypothetical protein S40288_09940 [Stachybotrys chartarum IBT 40288]